MIHETYELFVTPSVSNSALCSPVYYFRQYGNLEHKKNGEKERSDRTIKGKKKRQGKESRKGLTVRENVRLIEASFAQLFLVAARHCTERLRRMGSRCDLVPRRSPANNNPLKYPVMQETRAIRAFALAPTFGKKHHFPGKYPSSVLFTLDCSLRLGAWELLTLSLCYTTSHRHDLCIQVSRSSVNIALTHLTVPKKAAHRGSRVVLHFLSHGFSNIQPKGIKAPIVRSSVSFKSSLN